MKGAMQVAKRANGRVVYTLEFDVEDVEMPPDGDFGEQADEMLFVKGKLPDHGEYDLVHAEEQDSEPLYEDDFESEEDWPSYV